MKQKIYLWLFAIVGLATYAQPNSIAYQSTAYNGSTPAANSSISVRVRIVKEPGFVTEFEEKFTNVQTNSAGVFSINIGTGTATVGFGYVLFPNINWAAENKQLKVEYDPASGTGVSYGGGSFTALLSAPYALFAKSAVGLHSLTIVDDFNGARALTDNNKKPGDLVYIKGFTFPGDGGGGYFMWKTDDIFLTGVFNTDNAGTVLQSWNTSLQGRWVRQYDGYINAAYFGAVGAWGDNTDNIQRAINFAEIVADGLPDYKTHFQSSTVFVPNGIYIIDQLTLKSGVSLIGENVEYTKFYKKCNGQGSFMLGMEGGIVRVNVANFTLEGGLCCESPSQCNLDAQNGVAHYSPTYGIFLNSTVDPNFGTGGLWNSTFKNIVVQGFDDHAIWLTGSGNAHCQQTVFENVRAYKHGYSAHALYLENMNTGLTFINCQFDGFPFTEATLGQNVYIKGNYPNWWLNPTGVSFLTSTFQNGDYGIYIDHADNISIDTCWFENLGMGVKVDGTFRECRGINLNGNSFANVGGYGQWQWKPNDAQHLLANGYCVWSKNSLVNVSNSITTSLGMCSTCGFAYAEDGNLGMNLSGNTYWADYSFLTKSRGVMQPVSQSGSTLDCRQNNEVSASGSGTITTLASTINTGETVTIVAASTLVFSKIDNIFFPGSASTLTLSTGQSVEFVKMDYLGSQAFQLVAIKR